MTIYMSRDDCTDRRTLGTMTFDDGFVCQTLEDPVRDGPKVYGDTAIPSGTFKITISRSKKFNKMLPLINDVPGFGGVRIHAGNSVEDTSGCPLVGMERNQDPESDLCILRSREAMDEVQPRISAALAQGDPVWLDIVTPRVTTSETFLIQEPV
jgi:hypothetical protein